MGVNARVFELLVRHCRRIERYGLALVAGYPDMLVNHETLQRTLGRVDFPIDPHSREILVTHGVQGQVSAAPDPAAVFKELGYPFLTIIDIHRDRGPEKICDLNFDQDLPLFDLVLDHGIIEHCFNIGQAAINLARAVVPGGFIIQHLPANLFNHGFYNLNPLWFWDFYSADNGFEIVHFEGWPLSIERPIDLPRSAQFTDLPRMTMLTCVAQRLVGKEITFPMQGKYRR